MNDEYGLFEVNLALKIIIADIKNKLNIAVDALESIKEETGTPYSKTASEALDKIKKKFDQYSI